ncbi:RNA-directed DNA polymerase, eukaryota, reverse transcriptase zinc-binding domain protein [Tanacetum coccineum]
MEGRELEVKSVMGIQESKSNKEHSSFIHSLWGSSNCDFALKKAVGNSGGIIAIWDVSMLRKNKVIVDEDGFIAIYGEWINTQEACLMIVVYAPQDAIRKRSLWIRLNNLVLSFHATSIVLGDFNEVRFESERLGSTFCKYGVSNHFIAKWPNAQLLALPRELSDHCPIILKTHCDDYGPIPFKIFNSWLLNDDLTTLICQNWSIKTNTITHQNSPHPAISLKQKLQVLKNAIRIWKRDVVSKNDLAMCELKTKINLLDEKAENVGLDSQERSARLSYMKNIDDLENIIRLDLMQKAKVKWAIEGDENSKFFHGLVNNKFSRSRINGIYINGNWASDSPLVVSHIYNFHKQKF